MYKRIMIFGRPGSGKSTFANELSNEAQLPVFHLDKYFFMSNWQERDYNEFMKIQEELVSKDKWIIDGNSTKSLETRWAHADLIMYFNYGKLRCLFRLIKRLFNKSKYIDDRPDECREILRFQLIKYMWTFEKRVNNMILILKEKYPYVKFIEINSNKESNDMKKIISY